MSDLEPRTIVLLVEDETLVRMLGMELLEGEGFDVLEAESADEALEVLSRHDTIHLLLSDVDMPGTMNGLDLAWLVHQRWPNIRLLLTSGHQHLNDADIPDAGKFVRKPWRQDALIRKIREVLAAPRA